MKTKTKTETTGTEIINRLNERAHVIEQKMRKTAKKKNAAKFTATGRIRNEITLKDAIVVATRRSPKSLEQILESVIKQGYVFSGKRPSHSVGAFLYGKQGKKVFKNNNALFSPRASAVSK